MSSEGQEIKPQLTNESRDKAEFWNIVVFEFIGTLLIVYGSLVSESSSYGIALIYFVSLMLFGRISGGHFNPVITLILLIEGTITRKKAITYVLPQFGGSFMAAILGMPILHLRNGPYMEDSPNNQAFGTLIAEIFGSFLFFLFVCVQMNKKTEVSSSPIMSCFFISTIFYIARELTSTMDNSLFNPAAATGLLLCYGIYNGEWVQWINFATYLTGPWAGALLAITFYYRVYVKTLIK